MCTAPATGSATATSARSPFALIRAYVLARSVTHQSALPLSLRACARLNANVFALRSRNICRMTAMKAAILAGGRGRRMGGVPKALVEWKGRRIVDRQLDVLAPLFDEVLLVVAEPRGWNLPRAREVIDRAPGQGPLAGLQTALLEAGDVFVVACDFPEIDPDLVRMLCGNLSQASVLRVRGRPQPLFARYRADVLPFVEARLERGERRMLDLLADLDVSFVDTDVELINVNTPGDLR
jgi:molybdenum cofactor guanylyltransferase